MLRPDHFIDVTKKRVKKGQSDFLQLLEGVQIGGIIVVGGTDQQLGYFETSMKNMNRLGQVLPVANVRKLDPNRTHTFDMVAIAQMLMVAKNEAFHNTIDSVLNMLQQTCVVEGKSIEMGLQLLREQADTIDHM